MSQEVIEITEREIEVIEVVEKGPAGPVGPQANINYTVVSSPQTLSNSQNIAADTLGGSFTLTLPANPSAGDSIDIFDYSETFDTNPLTIARNGQNIESIAEDLICNVEGAYFTMIYTGATRGWQILPRYGTTGGGGESVLTTQGDMVYRGAAINERLPIGSAGQILKVNSGGNAPEWGAAPATGVTSVGVTGSDGIEVDSGSPVTGSGSIALGVNAATLRSHINVADGANNYTHPNHSGEVTSSGDGATTIANDVVTNAKLANVATATIKGRATAGTGDPEDLSASQVRTILNVADGAEVNVQSNWTEADSGSDAFILNKPTLGGAAALNVGTTTGTVCAGDDARLSDSRTPTAHAASHASAGNDPLAPSDIGAQSLFAQLALTYPTDATPYALSAARAVSVRVFTTDDYTVRLPESGHLTGDIIEIRADTLSATKTLTIEKGVGSTAWAGIATITSQGGKRRFVATGTGRSNWLEDTYFTTNGNLGAPAVHDHAASDITSGTLAHERGGLETDVSAYSGLVKIDAGTTSAVTVTSAAEALLDDADAAAQRTTLGLGNSATLDTGTTAGTVAEGDHTHADLHTRSHAITSASDHTAGNHKVFYSDGSGNVQELALGNSGEVLTSNGASAAPSFAAAAASGVSAVNSTLADILSVSGSDLVADDLGSDKIYGWDDSESKAIGFIIGSGLSVSGDTLSATASGGSKTYAVFSAEHNQPPSTAFATLDTRNSIAVLDFDDATDESAVFVSIIPEGASLGSGLKIRLHWMATTATSGDVIWDVSLERMTTDLDSDSFDTIASGTAAANGTSGILTVTEITLTTIDSVTAGDGFRLKVTRDADNGSDSMSGDAELVLVEVRSAA